MRLSTWVGICWGAVVGLIISPLAELDVMQTLVLSFCGALVLIACLDTERS